ncbi:hypothetical protein LX73_2295 [Fodinibius salinus]|uniref:Uncharacterized protein n=1 Tax=Fodinibius salinus TaxID=860790 RepID=A0A5D3YHP9_9BACT|nr:hypothetical protein [Fodinibius salinus]TYP92049.1 hypothetical protein LX73_2295 [Fodinibius salinus]
MSSDKNELTAKDLALYSNCKVQVPKGMVLAIKAIYPNADFHHLQLSTSGLEGAYSVGAITPILRPLSDMTNTEALEVAKEKFPNPDKAYWHKEWDNIAVCKGDLVTEMDIEVTNPDGFKYLLERNIDLFGWIDAGLAIDATTLTPNPYRGT